VSDTLSPLLHAHGCQVVALTTNPQAAEHGADSRVRMSSGDIEQLILPRERGDDRFDVIVAALPNVAHASIRLALLNGRFPSGEGELLDGAQLRFFTRDTAQTLFEDAGYAIDRFERQGETEVPVNLPADLAEDPDALARQFIVVAYPLPDGEFAFARRRMRELVAENDAVQLELRSLRERLERQERGIALLRDLLQEEVSGREAALGERDRMIQHLRQEIAGRETAIGERDRSIESSQRELARREAAIDERDQEIQTTRAVVRAQQAEIAQRDQLIRSLEAQLGGLDEQSRRVREMQGTLAAMEATRLWRLGRLYWRTRDWVRRRRGNTT
jgi:DNA repair exonuclease SbcCD ATPase subunit